MPQFVLLTMMAVDRDRTLAGLKNSRFGRLKYDRDPNSLCGLVSSLRLEEKRKEKEEAKSPRKNPQAPFLDNSSENDSKEADDSKLSPHEERVFLHLNRLEQLRKRKEQNREEEYLREFAEHQRRFVPKPKDNWPPPVEELSFSEDDSDQQSAPDDEEVVFNVCDVQEIVPVDEVPDVPVEIPEEPRQYAPAVEEISPPASPPAPSVVHLPSAPQQPLPPPTPVLPGRKSLPKVNFTFPKFTGAAVPTARADEAGEGQRRPPSPVEDQPDPRRESAEIIDWRPTEAPNESGSAFPEELRGLTPPGQFEDAQGLIDHYQQTKRVVEAWKATNKKYASQLAMRTRTTMNSVGMVSDANSKRRVQDIWKILRDLLAGRPVSDGRDRLLAKGAKAISCCQIVLVENFVKQAEDSIAVHESSSYPLAQVTVALASEFPDVSRLLLGRIYERCPWVVPFYQPGSLPDYSPEATVDSAGLIGRQRGIVRVLAALVVTPGCPENGVRGPLRPNPWTTSLLWTLLAQVANLPPQQDATAVVVFEILQVAGWKLRETYRRQFDKLFKCLKEELLLAIGRATPHSQSALFRMQNLLESGPRSLKRPEGFWGETFWQ